MNAEVVTAWLPAHGPTLALGATLVLAAGTLAMRLHRAPVQRRRLGLLTAFATAAYLLLAAVPLPRVFPDAPAVIADRASFAPLPAAARAHAIEQALMQLDASAPAERAPATLVPAVPGAAPSPTAWPWQRVLVVAYVGGAVLFLLRMFAGAIRLRLLLASCADVALPHLSLPKRTRLLASPRDVRPFCAGALRPVIVVPRALLAPERRAEALAVIRHEAAHVRNGDAFAQTVLALLAIPLFWHPLLWWLARDVRFHGELLADDAAAGAARTAYARALLDLAEHAQPGLRVAGTVAVFHRPSEFFRRIQMLLQREGSLTTSISFCRTASHSLAALALVAASAGLFGVRANAQEPRPSREAELRNTIETLRADLAALREQLTLLKKERGNPALLDVTYGELMPDGRFQPLPQPTLVEGTSVELYDVQGHYRGLPPGAAPTPAPSPQAGEVRIGDESYGYESRRAPGARTPPPALPPGPGPGGGAPNAFGPRVGGGEPPAATPYPDPLLAPHGGDNHAAAATADLASRYLDLHAELELAETAAEESKRLVAAGLAPQHEGKRAAVNLRTLQRKLALVDKLLNGEIAATEAEVAWLAAEHDRVAPHERGRVQAQLQRATMRLEAMRSVR